jgi:hypothetical protein
MAIFWSKKMSNLFLDDDDLAELTGWKQKSKQRQHLMQLGIKFIVNSDGRPKVTRRSIEQAESRWETNG